MTVLQTHWPQLYEALSQDDTLRGQWSFKENFTKESQRKIELLVSSPFYETWVRLRHATLLAPLEQSGQFLVRYRKSRKSPGRRLLKGPWNRLALDVMEQARVAAEGTFFISGLAGSGKSFACRHVFGSEFPIYSIRSLSRQLGLARKQGNYRGFVSNLAALPILILDDVHHLFDMPAVGRWLPQMLDLRANKTLVLLGRWGPGFEKLTPQLKGRFLEGIHGKIEYPDLDSRRQLIQTFMLQERLKAKSAVVSALCSRPLTPGRLLYLVRCIKNVPTGNEDMQGLVRELLRFAHADDLKLLLRHICFQYGTTPQDLKGKRRPEDLQKARGQYASMALSAGWRPAEVALMLERSSRSVQDLARRYEA